MLVIKGKQVFTTIEELVNPEYTAFILIDLQNDYISPGGCNDKRGFDISSLRQIVTPVKNVLQEARNRGIMVVHIQMTLKPDFLLESPASLRGFLLRTGYNFVDPPENLLTHCIEGTWGWQIVDELTPQPDEIVIRKHRSSAFMGTSLDMILRSNGIKSLAIAGVITNGCVLATATDAPLWGYYPVILRDCIASPLPNFHDAALLIMSRVMDTVDSGEVLATWNRSR